DPAPQPLGLSPAPAPGESARADHVQELVGERSHGPQQAVAAQVVDGGLANAELGELLDPVLDHRAPVVEAPAEAELVPESAKKNEPRPVRQLARAVAQPERSGIALHMRPGTNMMRAHRLGASECEEYFLPEAPVF